MIQPSADPEIVYELKPNLRGRFHDALVETNRFGLRGPEISQEKPERTYRIAGLGDSHMFGQGVGQEEFYLALLQRKLNESAESGWRFETLNFGTPGYNTVMEVGTFEHRALAFDPDLVLLHFIGNDLVAPHFLLPPRRLDPSDWYLVELAGRLLGASGSGDEVAGPEDHEDRKDGRSKNFQRRQYSHLKGRVPFQRAMEHLAELTRARGIPVLHFTLGQDSRLHRMARDTGLDLGFRFFDPQPTFGAMLREMNAPQSESPQRLFIKRGSHPNQLGHEAYARALFCELQRMGIPHLEPNSQSCVPSAVAPN